MSWVSRLDITHFRNYVAEGITLPENGFIVLFGPNGAGKTNVLEALSLLSPGRGLRGAKLDELQNQASPSSPEHIWSVAAAVETPYGAVKIGTGFDRQKNKRTVRIQGENAAQNMLPEYLSCLWLTPQMDRLFIDGAAGRRKFLDRLIFAFDGAHAGRLTRYENALRQRSKVLQDTKDGYMADTAWLTGLESNMAETGVAVAAVRLDFVTRLQRAVNQATKHENSYFPAAALRVHGTIEELLLHSSALEVEELFRHQLKQSRERDAVTGGAATGPHKSDLLAFHRDKNMAADQCSTGEQKALLIGMTLAQSRLLKAERGIAPILLLDEVSAHLDEQRRAALYDILAQLGGQVWLTGTDAELFKELYGRAQFFHVEDSHVHALNNTQAMKDAVK